MKKIAVASKDGKVAKKIENSSEFTIFYIEDGVITNNEKLCRQVNNTMLLVEYLLDMDVNVLIVGEISEDIKSILVNNNVQIVTYPGGDVRKVTELFLIVSLGPKSDDEEVPNVIYSE